MPCKASFECKNDTLSFPFFFIIQAGTHATTDIQMAFSILSGALDCTDFRHPIGTFYSFRVQNLTYAEYSHDWLASSDVAGTIRNWTLNEMSRYAGSEQNITKGLFIWAR